MSVDVLMGEPEEIADTRDGDIAPVDPDEFFAKNAFRIVYQTSNFFLPQIGDLIDKGEVLNLRPEYQRRLRWGTIQKSRLIESLLLNIPVPPVFLYETEAARYEVMDGQQRLNAVREFIAGDFALAGLPFLKPLNGLRYYRCPPRIKRALDRGSLSAIVLLLESETEKSASGRLTLTDLRRFIFDRLNTGGTKLNPQEIRNAINPGVFNKIIIELTRFRLFTDVFDIPSYIETNPNDYYENPERQKNTLYASMGDCQLVLRYFALRDEANIRGSMRAMLDRAMEVQITNAEGEAWRQEYKERFTFIYDIFDGRPFLLPHDEKDRGRISAAIYDASMVAANDLWAHRRDIEADKANVQQRMANAMGDSVAMSTLTGQGNTANAVRARITLMHSNSCLGEANVSTVFGVISEEFTEDLDALRDLVNAFNDPHKVAPKARIAAANSATLLLAATFEEFVREMARAYARAVVTATDSFKNLPPRLATTAWRRTMETLARMQIDARSNVFSEESLFSDALTRFNVIYEFCRGDLSRDIYRELIHNENNMRPGEINSLFRVSNLRDVCSRLADKRPLLNNFAEVEAGKAHGRLLHSLEEFFDRRNGIAHSLNRSRSSGRDQIIKDIDMLDAVSNALCETLEALAPGAVPLRAPGAGNPSDSSP